jgi:hypothetical protein
MNTLFTFIRTSFFTSLLYKYGKKEENAFEVAIGMFFDFNSIGIVLNKLLFPKNKLVILTGIGWDNDCTFSFLPKLIKREVTKKNNISHSFSWLGCFINIGH